MFQILVSYIKSSKKILFEGNGYGDEWVAEAEKRGLSNIRTTPQALDAYTTDATINLFEKQGIMNRREQEARHAIYLETYTKKIQIESRVIGDLALNHIIPTAIRYQNLLTDNVVKLKAIFAEKEYVKNSATQIEMIQEISDRIGIIKTSVDEMTEERKKANGIEDHRKQAVQYCEKVIPYFETIRYNVDKLELLVDDDQWPLPKYREILFTK